MSNKKNNLNPKNNSTYWIYGLIISVFIIFSYLGNSSSIGGTKKINISTFEKYLNSSEVSKITIINKTLASCLKLKNLDKIDGDPDGKLIELSSKVKAVNFHIFEGLGHSLVKNIPFQIQKISENDRLAIAKLGIRLGVNLIYLPIVLKPKIIKLKAILWSLYNNEFYVKKIMKLRQDMQHMLMIASSYKF